MMYETQKETSKQSSVLQWCPACTTVNLTPLKCNAHYVHHKTAIRPREMEPSSSGGQHEDGGEGWKPTGLLENVGHDVINFCYPATIEK